MAHPGWRAISVVVMAFSALAGCGGVAPDTPTAAEAGATLKDHITRTLKGAQAQDVQVTDPGGKDIPCGDGTVKRTYAAKGKDTIGSGDSSATVLAMAGALDFVAEYDSTTTADPAANRQDLASKTFRTRITLSSPAAHQMVVSGETDCLPPK